MLLWGRDWHPGVIGIVASRLVERTGRPVIVVTIDEHGECKGSGRSVQGFNLHACIWCLLQICSSATAAMPWLRAFRCGKKICPLCAAA